MALSPRAARRLWMTRDASRGGAQPAQRGPGQPTAPAAGAPCAGPGASTCGDVAVERPGWRVRAAARADSPQAANLARLVPVSVRAPARDGVRRIAPVVTTRTTAVDVGVQVTLSEGDAQDVQNECGQVQALARQDIHVKYSEGEGGQRAQPADTITYECAIASQGALARVDSSGHDSSVGADTIISSAAIASQGDQVHADDGEDAGDGRATRGEIAHDDSSEQDSSVGEDTITSSVSISSVGGQVHTLEGEDAGDVQATRGELALADSSGQDSSVGVDTTISSVAIAFMGGRGHASEGEDAGDVQARDSSSEQDSSVGADTITSGAAIASVGGQGPASEGEDAGDVQATRPHGQVTAHHQSRRRWADYDDEDSDDEGLHDWAHQDDREAKRHLVTRRSKGERLPGRGVQPSEGAHSADEEERNKVRRPPQAGHRPVRHAPRGAKSSGGKHGKDKGKGAKDPDSAGGTRGQAAGSSRGTDSGKATKGGGKHRPPARGDQAPRPRGPDSITYQRAIAREHSQVHASVASTAPPSASRPAGSSKEDSGTQDAARREELRQLTERARRLNADLRAIPVQPGSQATAWALVGEFQADLLRTIQMRNPCTPDP